MNENTRKIRPTRQPKLGLEPKRTDLAIVKGMIDADDHAEATHYLRRYLAHYPDDLEAQYLLATVLGKQDSPAIAVHIWKSLVKVNPERSNYWAGLGLCYDQLFKHEEALECFSEQSGTGDSWGAAVNRSISYLMLKKWDEAIQACNFALSHKHSEIAKANKGFAYLAKRDYGPGWRYYEYSLGMLKTRQRRLYSDPPEPLWNGEKGKDKHVIVYSEQGLGDQIAGVEPLDDLIRDVTVTAFECDPKMAPFFQRNYPDIIVHGSQKQTVLDWDEPPVCNYSLPLFSIHKHYRKCEEDYSKNPYLSPEFRRFLQWRALFDNMSPRPKIGLAWSGGVHQTRKISRTIILDEWLPLLRADVDWISLEYKDRSEQIADFEARRKIRIHDFPRATQSPDFEDTAALIAACDAVVAVPTTAVHAAGAMGVPTVCMTHPVPNIHYAAEGALMPYYGSVHQIRRPDDTAGSKQVQVMRAVEWLESWLENREAA